MFSRCSKKHGYQCLGRSRGGFSTKIHLAIDGLGNSLRFILTGGERDDTTQAENLIANFKFKKLLADKGYDSDKFLQIVLDKGVELVVPTRVNRKKQRQIDRSVYRHRNLIERFIGQIKHYRRIFSRFDKLAKNYLSFIHLVSSIIWLK